MSDLGKKKAGLHAIILNKLKVKRTYREFGVSDFFNRSLALLFLLGLLTAGWADTAFAQTAPKKPAAQKKKPAATAKKPSAAAKPPAKKPSQQTAKTSRPNPAPTPTPVDPATEKTRFDDAATASNASARADLLAKYLKDFPASADRQKALEMLAVARAAMADEALSAGEAEKSISLFKLAVSESPRPYGDKFYSEVVVMLPSNLYYRGQPEAALDLAREIEETVSQDPKKLLALANFYLSVEDGTNAIRLAESAAKLDEKSGQPFLTIGLGHRVNFELDEAAAAYAKAIEIEPGLTAAKRSLAEMDRANGKPDEAIALYKDILSADESDNVARTGLILALFESGKKAEAESELNASLEAVPGNVVLLAGAAYWYAANNDGVRAEELARQAIAKDPRYIWSYIALGRALMLQNKPVDAERLLVSARRYGNFPTLRYEIASARLKAGFFREAAEELSTAFSVNADGKIEVRLGGRVERAGDSFTDVLAPERQASLFAGSPADTEQNALKLKQLTELENFLKGKDPEEAKAVYLAEEFSGQDDEMSFYRKLFAANLLLDRKVAAGKALELAQAATGGVENALSVASPGAATMATELYDARTASFARDDFLLIPEVPRQTLSALNRGRIEQTIGRALQLQQKSPEAEIRFRRALSVFPKDSAWWRSARWDLGESLEAQGKDEDALDALISSYKIDKPDISRYLHIQILYKKIKGSTDGLEDKIGKSPIPETVATAAEDQKPQQPTEAQPESSPSPTPDTAGGETAKVSERSPVAEPNPSDQAKPKEEEKKADPGLPQASATPETTSAEAAPSPAPVSTPETRAENDAETKTAPEQTQNDVNAAVTEPTPSPSPSETPAKPPTAAEANGRPLFEPIIIPIRTPKKVESNGTTFETRPANENTAPCSITISQDKVSLLNNGGSVAVIVNIEGSTDEINARSGSPADIEVHLDPGIITVPGRFLYIIRSTSDKTGMFEVSFIGTCGTKKIIVQVR